MGDNESGIYPLAQPRNVMKEPDAWEEIYSLMMVLKFDGTDMICVFTLGIGFFFVVHIRVLWGA